MSPSPGSTASDSLPTWPRPHFVAGGGNAFILFAAYGEIEIREPIDRQKYCSSRIPEGMQLLRYDRYDQPMGFQHYFQSAGWKPAAIDEPKLADAAKKSSHLVVLRGFAIDPATLDYLRDCLGVIRYLFDNGAVAVFDPQMLQLWSKLDWPPSLEGQPHEPHTQVAIIRTPEALRRGQTEWIHTRGLRKYGRPDLSIRGVGTRYADAAIELLNRYIEYQALGGIIEAGDVVTLEGLPPDGTCYPDPRLDHPDFHNAHVEIRWPGEGLR